MFTGRTTGERRDLCALERREGASGAGPGRIAQHLGSLPAAAPLPDRLRRTTDLAGNVGIAPVGMVVREQQQAGPLHFGEGCGGAGAEVLQAHLLLRREFNRIFW